MDFFDVIYKRECCYANEYMRTNKFCACKQKSQQKQMNTCAYVYKQLHARTTIHTSAMALIKQNKPMQKQVQTKTNKHTTRVENEYARTCECKGTYQRKQTSEKTSVNKRTTRVENEYARTCECNGTYQRKQTSEKTSVNKRTTRVENEYARTFERKIAFERIL
ncbi:hypothetical protein ACOME3_004882 [Neoechinorhynchus agilis]